MDVITVMIERSNDGDFLHATARDECNCILAKATSTHLRELKVRIVRKLARILDTVDMPDIKWNDLTEYLD